MWYSKQLCDVYLPNWTSKLLLSRSCSVWSFSNTPLYVLTSCGLYLSLGKRLVSLLTAGRFQLRWSGAKPPLNRDPCGSTVDMLLPSSAAVRWLSGMVLSFTGVGRKALWVGEDLRGELKGSSLLFAAAKQCWSSECARKNYEAITLCVWKWFSVLNVCFLKHFPVVWSITMVSVCVWNGTRRWNGPAAEACWWITSPLPLSCFKSACQKCTDWIKRAGKSNRVWQGSTAFIQLRQFPLEESCWLLYHIIGWYLLLNWYWSVFYQ